MDATEAERRPSLPDRKQRKSVVFSAETVVVQPDGQVTMSSTEENKEATAISHATNPVDDDASPPVDADAAADGGLLDLPKKKKKSKKTEEAAEEDGEAAADGDANGIDLTLKKKKKKKPTPKGDDDFAKKLAELEIKEGDPEERTDEQSGDMDKGTGIWSRDETAPIKYDLLLSRFFNLLSEKNPDHASSGSRSYKIPPPQCLREGNKKTIFANIEEISKRMKRSSEHVTAYLFAELGTSGSVDGSNRLTIKGRFQQKQLENVLRKYIIEYVTCKTCRSPDTELSKGENRLYFLTCNSCGSRRSVTAIKSGFTAQVGKRKKMQ